MTNQYPDNFKQIDNKKQVHTQGDMSMSKHREKKNCYEKLNPLKNDKYATTKKVVFVMHKIFLSDLISQRS